MAVTNFNFIVLDIAIEMVSLSSIIRMDSSLVLIFTSNLSLEAEVVENLGQVSVLL